VAEDKDKDAAEPKAAKKQTKEILRAVVFHDRTYQPGDEDHLEQRLTAERGKQLLETDPPSLAGPWHFKGKDEKPMATSKLAQQARGDRGRGPHPAAPEKDHPAVAENEQLRKELAKAKAELEAKEKAESSAAHADRHAKKAGEK
jgi:hypothetical protein